jgi:hypothetical protein
MTKRGETEALLHPWSRVYQNPRHPTDVPYNPLLLGSLLLDHTLRDVGELRRVVTGLD